MMKKNRLASKLSILVEEGALESIIRLVFRETSSIGVRYYPVKRRVLARRFESVSVLGEKVRIKLAELEGETVNIQPEFDDCLRAADKTGRPVKEVLALALQAYAEGNSEHEER
jgi:uncharacterized protein (DUF111 family)